MAKLNKRDSIVHRIRSQAGVFDQYTIANETGASAPYVLNVIKPLVDRGDVEEIREGRRIRYSYIGNAELPTDPFASAMQHFSVAERFDYVHRFAQLVVEGVCPSLFFTGVAGIGKTHLITQVLQSNNLVQDEHYITVKGHISPFGLYCLLYHNKNKITIFDDCDKAFENDISANILKAALDSYDKRVISWNSRAIPEDSSVEPSFTYKGKIIFVSNKPIHELDEAVKSRTMCVSLDMSRDEVTEHMANILPNIEQNVDLDVKQDVLQYLSTVAHEFSDYNLRTLIKAIRIRTRYDEPKIWQNMIKVTSFNE